MSRNWLSVSQLKQMHRHVLHLGQHRRASADREDRQQREDQAEVEQLGSHRSRS